jgi:8-oxo-dGTP pyrophosphatase MutT (NUDIX family)
MPTVWRPHQHVRAIAIGIIRRGDAILATAVQDDSGATKGWRPLGGTIEFGERAAVTLARELVEEIGEPITAPHFVAALENLYDHHGLAGHEIVLVFEAAFANASAYRRDTFHYVDGSVDCTATWVPLAAFRSGRELLFPEGLVELL